MIALLFKGLLLLSSKVLTCLRVKGSQMTVHRKISLYWKFVLVGSKHESSNPKINGTYTPHKEDLKVLFYSF